MPWYMWIALSLFMFGMIFTIWTIGKASADSDSKAEMSKAIGSVTAVNTILMLVLAGCGYMYVLNNALAERPYIMIMLHLSLLLSLVSVSVSSLQMVQS